MTLFSLMKRMFECLALRIGPFWDHALFVLEFSSKFKMNLLALRVSTYFDS